jgi:hypothetical protein
MNIYMVDVDDTLEGCGGPVQLEKLYSLRQQGHVIGLLELCPGPASNQELAESLQLLRTGRRNRQGRHNENH